MYRFIIVIACALNAASCSAVAPKAVAPACPLPNEEPYARIELFFGRDIPGRAPLTDAEWDGFVAHAITDQFPDGFTVFDGDGQWYDQASARTIRERSKILIVAADPESDLKTRIGTVVNAYKAQFHQSSVGILTSNACGAF